MAAMNLYLVVNDLPTFPPSSKLQVKPLPYNGSCNCEKPQPGNFDVMSQRAFCKKCYCVVDLLTVIQRSD